MSEPPLTDAEIRSIRSILRHLSAAEWKALKAIAGVATGGGPATSGGGSSNGPGEALPDHMLDNGWADKVIKKDPKRWAGSSLIGRNHSEAPGEWHALRASDLEWKVEQAKKEPSPRLQTQGKHAGKPWYEVDAFEAKIHRAWARRNQGKPVPPPLDPIGDGGEDAGSSPDEFSTSAADDEIPF